MTEGAGSSRRRTANPGSGMHRSHAPEERPLHPSATCGLTAAEVSARVDAGLDNRFTLSHRSVWEIVRSNVLTLFNAIVVGCFVVLLLLGDGEDALFGTLLVIGMIALWLLVVRSRPLTLLRISVVAAMASCCCSCSSYPRQRASSRSSGRQALCCSPESASGRQVASPSRSPRVSTPGDSPMRDEIEPPSCLRDLRLCDVAFQGV